MPPPFRRTLAEELPVLIHAEVITPEQAARFRDIYSLDEMHIESSSKLSSIIFFIGALLIGFGIFAFVAYHWEEMSATAKIICLISGMLFSHGTGFWLWEYRNRARLGHALVALGTLIFYASIGLIAQIFHISSDSGSSFVMLYAGAIAVAVALKSTPHYMIAALGILGWLVEGDSSIGFPFFVAHVVITIFHEWRAHSKSSAVVGYLAATGLALKTLDPYLELERHAFTIYTFFAVLPLLVSAIADRVSTIHRYAGVLTSLGLLMTSLSAYLLSYREVAEDVSRKGELSAAGIFIAIAIPPVLAIADRIVCSEKRAFPYAPIGLGASLLILCQGIEPLAIVAGNCVALALGGWTIKVGLDRTRSLPFWFGMLFVLLVIVSRFLEYDTGLIVKSIAFILTGVAVITGGLFFEKMKEER